jgi:UDP-glucose 4-epimerase
MNSAKQNRAVIVTGAAGFIGSHLVDVLLSQGKNVIGTDNFRRGTFENLSAAFENPDFVFIECDLDNPVTAAQSLIPVINGHSIATIWHMAANSDILEGVNNPSIDLRDTFLTTFSVLTIIKQTGIPELVFASSSAIYGNHPGRRLDENFGPLQPISNYGAMKLAGEAIISAAVEHYLSRAIICRFPNVVGPRSTHGVIHDLFEKLKKDTNQLEVLGDGTQQKPYLHVTELIDSMLFIQEHPRNRLDVYNIGPDDSGVTVSSIADAVLRRSGREIPIAYSGGDRGWVGDVPQFSYSIEKLRILGWTPKYGSKDAIQRAVDEIGMQFGY